VSSIVIDVSEAPRQLVELLDQVATGTEILLMEGTTPRARLVPVASRVSRRVPGLHRGCMTISPDFDAPLPDEFWAGSS
jgi:antitoxin (DNA-binding transcriptional repressor) of toxin-antitoxin stability system